MFNEVTNAKGHTEPPMGQFAGCGLLGAGVMKISQRARAHILWGTGSA